MGGQEGEEMDLLFWIKWFGVVFAAEFIVQILLQVVQEKRNAHKKQGCTGKAAKSYTAERKEKR